MKKVLIANRGEIALRVIRACKEFGIQTVAVYSTADTDSLHVRFADEAVCIGLPSPAQSYLNIPRIISAAEITNADAVHPGYGFLAENAEFAEICESHGISFIGPTAEMIRQMGDKIFAKTTMKKAGCPVIPGSEGGLKNVGHALELALEIGFPVILKAAAGGGGRGMRIVREPGQMEKSFNAARAEAQAGFGNPTVYMERFFERPHHVEVQLLGNGKGKVLALGERDCSIQRKHQKLIEESPSPAVDSELRARMVGAAIRGAESVGYRSAGTIEFLLDEDGRFYFMEMNTRIQVEHPVTEMVFGVDLIKEQIRVAAGDDIRHTHAASEPLGHAIECRINAEDPYHGFRPSPGRITDFHPPGGLGVRVDTHVYAGYQIPPFYDSLIAKLIVHGHDREEALKRMSRSLEEFILSGITTTIPFHKQVMVHPAFVEGKFSTHFLDNFQLSPEHK
ncbi:MAG TPA: acetyl-CoA carboxylase biotin carboxylase subunit [bacterium]|nr:acetyl-CoA carboxylase biotin carboxylase subunit [bacterium]